MELIIGKRNIIPRSQLHQNLFIYCTEPKDNIRILNIKSNPETKISKKLMLII